MENPAVGSDEPTRLANIITKMFAGQAGWSRSLHNDETARLLVGADGQDDCAVFRLDGPMELVLGSDYVRGAKFSLYEMGYLNNFDIGYYLASANFSDIAAMGALPIGLLSVIRYPKTMTDAEFESVVDGVHAACSSAGARNIGGDIGTAERIILSGTAVGIVEPGRSLLRNGASAGDHLCITGPTGNAAAAQKYFGRLDRENKRISHSDEDELISSWKRPEAKVRQGRLLSTSGLVTSCLDSSDGLKAAIETIAARSGVGFIVNEADLPITELVAKVASLSSSPTTPMMLGDSVDFQLAFTVADTGVEKLRKIFEEAGLPFYDIGIATEDRTVRLQQTDGKSGSLPGAPWRHST